MSLIQNHSLLVQNSSTLSNIKIEVSLKVSFICNFDTDTGISFMILIRSNTFDTEYSPNYYQGEIQLPSHTSDVSLLR